MEVNDGLAECKRRCNVGTWISIGVLKREGAFPRCPISDGVTNVQYGGEPLIRMSGLLWDYIV